MRTALLVLALLAAPTFAAQTVWKWVDAKGVVHYSDRPVPGAEKIELSVSSAGTTTSDAPPPPASRPSSPQRDDTAPAYRTFEIWKPANDEAVINSGGRVEVNVRLEPELQSGHTLSLYLNGALVEGQPPNAQQFQLNDVPRGMHQVVATITDQLGREVIRTAPVTFHVRQHSILNPNNRRPGR